MQTFLPSPMALATAMYHSGHDPLHPIRPGAQPGVAVPRGLKQRRLHKALLRYHDPENWPLIRDCLKRLGRTDIIGPGRQHLVPAYQKQRGPRRGRSR